jgi:glycerol-3-phosphate dehydrogenase
VLIFPYLEGKVMIGTTDLRIEDPDQATCTEEEIEYILGMVPRIFPDLAVSRDQIIFQFSGVRPLPVAKGVTGQISRDHSIELLEKSPENPWPILSLVGGKWTSYRAFSEQVTDQVLERLKINRQSSTTNLPIGGSRDYPSDQKEQEKWIASRAEKYNLDPGRTQALFSRYGTRTEDLLKSLTSQQESFLSSLPAYSREEIRYLAREEMIVHLDDFFLRRSKLAWTDQVTSSAITEVAAILGEILGWDQTAEKKEISRTMSMLQNQHRVRL